jgi:cyclic pyranopterin phosphate synthase
LLAVPMSLPILAARSPKPGGGVPPPAAPDEAVQPGRLIDSHGRTIRDLRLSITDRCNFRCIYCMDPDVKFMEAGELLSAEELVRIARVCVGMGIDKVRITGGEPTVHPHLEEIIRGVAATGVDDIAITTNGSLMDTARARAWRAAGLARVTVSLDSASPEAFAAITRSKGGPQRVIDAVRAAVEAGLESTKLNAVVIRGVNEDQVVPLAALARDLGVEMRYIEFMPLDSGHRWSRASVVTAEQIIAAIDAEFPVIPAGRHDPSSTSLNYRYADGAPGGVGVIAPVSRPFCGACSRLRVTADGKVRPCLFSRDEWDLRPLLRGGADDEALARFLVDATWTKQSGHGISTAGFVQPERPMSAIGG